MQTQLTSRQKIPLWLITLLLLAGYILLGVWFPLAPYFHRFPPMDIRKFTPTLSAGLAYGLLLLLLFALFALAYQRVRTMAMPPKLWVILLATVLFCVPLIQTYPFNATDIYRYIILGRVNSVYQESPYISSPADFPDDPFFPLAGEWANETSPYGPVWELLSTAVTGMIGENLLLLLTSFKVIGLLTHLGCAILIWLLLANAPPSKQIGYTLLWAWNPALLLTFVVDAHNDGLMIFWLLLGLWIMRQNRPTLGILVMLLAALTKSVALLPLPLFFITGWHTFPNTTAKLRYGATVALGGLVLGGLVFLPFGSPFLLATRLLREASNIPGFSISTLILLAFVHVQLPPPTGQLVMLALGLFALFALWLAWRTWNGRSPIRGSADIFAGYMAQALSFRIWYASWPFPWLLVDDTESDSLELPYRLKVGLWFLVTSQLSVLIYGHIRYYLLNKEQYFAHLIGVPFTFLLPFLLALIKRPLPKTQQNNILE